jgi:hypothetical protein
MVWTAWQNASTIIGTIGGVCGLWSLWYARKQATYARKQTDLMEEDRRRQEEYDQNELAWSERFEKLANQIVRINPSFAVAEPGKNSTVYLYSAVFPDAQLRTAIENYIVKANAGYTQFITRNPRPDELRRSNLRDTVKKAEEATAVFQKQNAHIDLTYYMG